VTQADVIQILTTKCEVCHTLNGKGGTIGPDLNEVMAGKTLPLMVPGGHPTQETWLVSWISDPQKIYTQAIMPDLGLTQAQAQAVAAYLLKVK
jgi:mono/diheme cytochrome c family protein